MKFDEFHPGQSLELGATAVTEEDIVRFARQWDPQWFHVDAEAARAGPFEGLIASGWHTCAIAMRKVADEVLAGSESFASPGLDYLKWPHPVRAGDTLRMRLDILEKRRSTSRPELGLVKWRWTLRNQHDALVLDAVATSMFRLTPS